MPTIATDADSVCTEIDLALMLGGDERLRALLPKGWSTAKPARTTALERIIEHLMRLSPPVYESELLDVTEMKRGVMYGAAEHLYTLAVTRGNDGEVFFEMMKHYAKKFEHEMEHFRPLVNPTAALTVDPLRSKRANSNRVRVVRR